MGCDRRPDAGLPGHRGNRFPPTPPVTRGTVAPAPCVRKYGSVVAHRSDPPRSPAEAHPVLVVDFGAQYAQLIARRVREARVYSEIVPSSLTAEQIAAREPAGVIFSGGPASVHVEGAPSIDPAIYDLGVPVLGICYGAQLMAQQLGGLVEKTDRGEYGRTPLDVVAPDAVVFGGGQPTHQQVWMSHRDSITRAPDGFTVTASSADAPVAAMEHVDRRLHAVQFHPEVVHTPDGAKLLANFVHRIAGLKGDWTMAAYREQAVAAISVPPRSAVPSPLHTANELTELRNAQ